MAQKTRTAFQRLYETAEAQQGFFTTKQAKAAGFDEKNHPYHVRTGHWAREHRGIYRLTNFPRPERPDLLLWFLWSRNRKEVPEGVYSHQTALSLYDLSDLMPSKLHMTVPRRFRRSGPIPQVLVLHRADLHKDDIGVVEGIRVTKPLQTIADLVREKSVSPDFIHQSVRQALARGLVRRSDVDKNPRLALSVREEIKKAMTERS